MLAYHIGSILEYQTFCGTTRRVRIDEKSDNIKNDKAGFGGYVVDINNKLTNHSVWGYDYQITNIIEY
jgi:hypothetical protein